MFANIFIAGTKMNTLLDTGTFHLFISNVCGQETRLENKKKAGGRLKTVNSEEILARSIAQDVNLHVDTWEGNTRGNSP